MDLDEVIALINAEIVANGNQEITADVLRPILLAMLQQPNDLIGDLNDLTTTANDNLVNAINEINAGGSFTQDNIPKIYGTFGVSGTGEMTNEDVATYINTQTWDIEKAETDTPLLVSFFKNGYIYVYLFLRGFGTYPTVDEDDFYLLIARLATPSDITVNSQTFNLDPITTNFIDKANESTWDFSDSGELNAEGRPKSYYFSYTDGGILYYALFIGNPALSPYGDGGTAFVAGDFTTTTNNSINPIPTLQQVTGSENTTTNPIVIYGTSGYKVSYEKDGFVFTDADGNTQKVQFSLDSLALGDIVYQLPIKDTDDTFAMVSDLEGSSERRFTYIAPSDTDTFIITALIDADSVDQITSQVAGVVTDITFNSATGEISDYPILTGEKHIIFYTKEP